MTSRLMLIALVVGIHGSYAAPTSAATLDLGTARLTVDRQGVIAGLEFADGTRWPTAGESLLVREVAGKLDAPQELEQLDDRWRVKFADGSVAEFRVTTAPGVAVFRLVSFTGGPAAPPAAEPGTTRWRLFSLAAPPGARVTPMLNAAFHEGHFAAVLPGAPNVRVWPESGAGSQADRAGCHHTFEPCEDAQVGRRAARFTATSNEQPGGWSVRGKRLPRPLDLSGCRAIRAWVNGDGQGEALKIQLSDARGGYRDDYLTIDFHGWRHVTLDAPALNTLDYRHTREVSFYYNSLPTNTTVTCLLDQVEAVVTRDGVDQAVLLEDFEASDSTLWSSPHPSLRAETADDHGLEPAVFGVVAGPAADYLDTIERFQLAAEMPHPCPGGVWNKKSPWIKRSYFFLTDFRESQFDAALDLARRGGFDMILLGQESWADGTGHYAINRQRFPDGLAGLQRTFERFRAAGFHVGLHFLGASIYPPDPYLVPVPDPRLVHGARTTLAADIDTEATFLPTDTAPDEFPAEDGGYMGSGTVLQVGDELIVYGQRNLEAPYGFDHCRRGHLGTTVAPHRRGDPVVHLRRAYGYHMYDMDTSLMEEVAGHFAQVANACRVDMIYFDGSELLQGDHWYYNARLHKAFFDQLQHKDVLLQASSYSPYSWHLMARSASADGHGDLKGYLDERSGWFDALHRDGMPLDIGWYYGYDPNSTLDQYEYILGATIGYDSSMSFQVSCQAAAEHPFTHAILDLIARYEQLRLSGRVPESMRQLLRIDPVLTGKKTPAERAALLDKRRDYRLLGPAGGEYFQRVVYGPWHELTTADEIQQGWPVTVTEPGTRIGVQIHARPGAWLGAGAAYQAADAMVLEPFEELAPYASGQRERSGVRRIDMGEGGAVSEQVTQQFELSDNASPHSGTTAVYTAENHGQYDDGWSVIGKTFDPPLDLSWHQGIGFWLQGDGQGGQFKLQLTDGRGATDYYITNDFTGWRYQQLPRPQPDPIDYGAVRTLNFYYNGLPGGRRVCCGLDDVKALRRLDEQVIVDPTIELGDQRWQWHGALRGGQYLFFWPGEPVQVHGGPQAGGAPATPVADTVVLPPGDYTARFSCRGAAALSVRIRVTQQTPERHEVPPP